MILNNSKTVVNLKVTRRISIILYLTFLLLAFIAKVIRFPIMGIDKIPWTIFITVLFLVIVLVPEIMKYQYVFFSDEGDSIIFRFYSAGMISGKKNSVEINKRTFSGFTIDKSCFGLVESITLYQRMKEGVAKYPPIYLSALRKADKKEIIRSINSFAPIIKGNIKLT